MKKVLLLLSFGVSCLFVNAGTWHGTCNNGTWTFNTATGVFTVSGNGNVGGPWYSTIPSGGVAGVDYPYSGWLLGNGVKRLVLNEGITGAMDNSFFGYTEAKTITFPTTTLKTIGEQAFFGAWEVTSMNIPNSVVFIGERGLADMKKAIYVHLPNQITTLESGVLQGASSLVSLIVPNSVKEIKESAFISCEKLRYITLPFQLEILGDGVFNGCENLEFVSLPNTLHKIGNRVFYDCKNLEKVVIPANVDTIGERCFIGCSNLEEVRFGRSVDTIGREPFQYCSNLKDVYMYSTNPPKIESCALRPQNVKLHVPCSSMDEYMEHPVWGQFEVHCASLNVTMLNVSAGSNNDTLGVAHIHYNNENYNEILIEIGTTIELIATAATGCHFVQWDDGNTQNPRVITPSSGHTYIAEFEKDNIETHLPKDIQTQIQVEKVLRDGNIFILRDNKTYTLQGQEVK